MKFQHLLRKRSVLFRAQLLCTGSMDAIEAGKKAAAIAAVNNHVQVSMNGSNRTANKRRSQNLTE